MNQVTPSIVRITGTSSEVAAGQRRFVDRFAIRWDYGINHYWAGSRNNGLWTGASAAVALAIHRRDNGMHAITVNPRIGGGIDYLLAGVDFAVRLGNKLEIFTCVEWQRFVEVFGSFGYHWSEHLENGTFRNNVFAGGGLLLNFERHMLEFRLTHSLTSSVHAESLYYNDSVKRSFLTTSVSVGWKLW